MDGNWALTDGAGAMTRRRAAMGRAPLHRRPPGLAPLIALLLIAAPPAAAQQGTDTGPVVVQPDNSLPDTVQMPAFAAFWQRFRAAVRANDRGQLQAMTHLPFDFDGRSYAAADFAALAPRLYDAKTRHCLLTETPLHDQDMYEVFCGETVYVFSTDPDLPDYAAANPDGSAWRLIEIGAND
jgi:hypothetical protein